MPDCAAGFARRLLAGSDCLGNCFGEAIGAVRRADRDAVLRILAGQEALGRIVEGDLAARLREHVHRRRPASRHQDRVDRDRALRPAALGLHGHRRHAQLAAGANDGAAMVDLDAERARLVDRRAGRIVANIDDRRDIDAGPLQVDRRRIGGIVGRVDADIFSDSDAIMVEIDARRRGKHDAWPVIVGEHHVALDGAGRDHHALGADLPQPLARQVMARLGEVVADPLDQADEILRVVAERRGARQHAHIVHRGKPGDSGLRPTPASLAVDLRAGLEAQRAAKLGLLVADDDAHAGFGGGQRRRDAGRAAAQHQHLAMSETRRIVVGIGLVGRHAKAGRGADIRFVDAFPGGLRPHEGLVVEAGGKHRRRDVVDRADVEGERRPAVLRDRIQPVIELLHRGAHVRRLSRRIARNRHQRIGFLGAGRENAARPMIFERAADQMDAVGDQRRGEGVALPPFKALPVESEAEPLAVEAAGAGDAIGFGHHAISADVGILRCERARHIISQALPRSPHSGWPPSQSQASARPPCRSSGSGR